MSTQTQTASRFSIFIPSIPSLNDISDLLRLRVAISFLGEKSQNGWWQSDFFGPTASSFLDPVFPRTRFLNQVEGASAAAGLLHDDRIGVGRVFHLFRLPEDFEQSFHQRLHDQEVIDELSTMIASRESATEFLESKFGKSKKKDVGPISVGNIQDVSSDEVVSAISQHYQSGFQSESPVFPYLKAEQ